VRSGGDGLEPDPARGTRAADFYLLESGSHGCGVSGRPGADALAEFDLLDFVEAAARRTRTAQQDLVADLHLRRIRLRDADADTQFKPRCSLVQESAATTRSI
jgi:hypothetical protein